MELLEFIFGITEESWKLALRKELIDLYDHLNIEEFNQKIQEKKFLVI